MNVELIKQNVALAPYTSWLVGGAAEYFAAPTQLEDVFRIVAWAQENKTSLTVFGGGSNVLISDQGIPGLVLCLRKLTGLQTEVRDNRLHITALAGTGKSELLKVFLKQQLDPALFLAGLPGDVGGGVAMNAGVGESFVPREFVELVDWVEVLPIGSDLPGSSDELVQNLKNSVRRFAKADLQWGYRHCTGWQPGIILRAGLLWPMEPKPEILAQVREANKIRLSRQPLHLPSCGSVFKNPPGHKSGALIDQCGLRGFTHGGAQVSEKHANFIVNTGSASAQDVHNLITHVQAEVLRQKGVELKTEVVYLGHWPQRQNNLA